MPLRPATDGVTPILASLFMVGSAVILAVGFYAASHVAAANSQAPAPSIGWWDDPAHDRLLVVSANRDTAWSELTVMTDAPARVRVNGDADALTGQASVPGVPTPLDGAQMHGGDTLGACRVGTAGDVRLTVRHAPTESVLLSRTIAVDAC